MSNVVAHAKKQVPFGKKIAFGLGMLANQMFPAALGIFMVVLVQDLGFPTWMWGVLFFLPRVFDSITDPIMGFISDNTRSRWGRRRHYVMLGAIIMGVSFCLMWQLYKVDGLDYNFIYFLLWSLVFYLGLTIFSVPFVAMGYEMSDDFHERTSIMAVAQWIGQWAWVIAPWFWVIMYDPDWFPTADVATRTLAIYVGIGCAILAMIPAIFLKSTSTLDDTSLAPLNLKGIGNSVKGIVKGFVEAYKLVPFRKLCISTFFIFNAFNTIAGFSFFIIVYYLFDGVTGDGGAWIWPTLFGSIGSLVTTFLVIPIVAKMSRKMGKKNAFLVSQGISIIGYIMLWFLFIPGKPWLFLFALPFFSFGIGGLFTLMMSMTADVCDLDELNYGQRREGIFGAIYWWMVKFGLAIAGLLSGLIMSMLDFTPGAATQPEGAVDGLRIFFSVFPIMGTAIAMYVMRDYDITEERALAISAELAQRKIKKKIAQTSSAYGSGYLKGSIISDLQLSNFVSLDLKQADSAKLKKQFSAELISGINGLCFSPYVEGQDADDILSKEQVDRRMKIIAPYTSWVRSFACTGGNELIPQSAKNADKKTIVGAWISGDRKRNELEIDNLIKLAIDGKVDIAAIGNEVLLRGEITETELIEYIKRVKAAVAHLQVEVGYVDTYYQYSQRPALVNVVDVILANCYPFWEGYSVEDSLLHLRQMHAIIKNNSNGKRLIITETGWPSQGQSIQDAHPTTINAMKYFIQTQNWAKNEGIELFHFSSFDESWKADIEGELGARWGIWDKFEEPKYK
jgi:GPH family glycoside/pentoside/hexuronide:cation symporter